jgi:DNA (cytosine-5)-methyltransferase 1
VELHGGAQPLRPVAETGATNGFWSDAEWIWCRDGKYRPAKPGIFPLVAGFPNRVGALRGAGNAIVAPLAAEFIRAAIDCGVR